MKVSPKGLEFTQDMEGTRYYGYLDTGGVPTAGVGHTGPEVVVGKHYTQEEVIQWLAEDIEEAEEMVNRLVKVPLTQNQFDMLCDFAFNIGEKQFGPSTLLKKLNAGDYRGAAEQFKRWVYDAGKIQPGLVKRNNLRCERFMEN